MSLLIFFLNEAITHIGMVKAASALTSAVAVGMSATALIATGTAAIGRLSPGAAGDT